MKMNSTILNNIISQFTGNDIIPEPYCGPVFNVWRPKSVDSSPSKIWYDNFVPHDCTVPIQFTERASFYEPFIIPYQAWAIPDAYAIDTTNCSQLPGTLRALYPTANTSPFSLGLSGGTGLTLIMVPKGATVSNIAGCVKCVNTTAYYLLLRDKNFQYVSNYIYYGDYNFPQFPERSQDKSYINFINWVGQNVGEKFIVPLSKFMPDSGFGAYHLPTSGFANCFSQYLFGPQDSTSWVTDIMPVSVNGIRWRVTDPVSDFTDYLKQALIP